MLLGVISDTHGQTRNTLEAIQRLEAGGVEAVIHCGDIGSTNIVQLFRCWPTHFVFGNVDHPGAELSEAIQAAGQTCHGRFGSLELDGKRVAFLHGDDSRRWHEAVNSGEWDLICYGHTHKSEWKRSGQTWLLNPGAVFRAKPHSVAIVTLPELTVEFLPF